MQTKPKLEFLFTAIFADGSRIMQTSDDVSQIDPTRSAFYDVIRRLDEVETFMLEEARLFRGKRVSVNLKTGLFQINGVKTQVHAQNFIAATPPELVYFRETHVQSTFGSGDDPVEIDRKHYVAQYFLGWHAKDQKGHDTQIVIGVS